MSDFTIHTHETAPEGSKKILEGVKGKYGFVPNLIGGLAESPVATEAYTTIGGIFEKSDFTPTERQVVLITANFDNGCTYCMAAHTTMSKRQKLPEDVIQALRDNTPIADAKLEALRVFTRAVFHKRGWVDQADLDAFYAAGYEKHHVLEVVVGLAFKTISNYTNHVVDTPVDDAFAPNAWSKPEAAAAE